MHPGKPSQEAEQRSRPVQASLPVLIASAGSISSDDERWQTWIGSIMALGMGLRVYCAPYHFSFSMFGKPLNLGLT